MTGRYHPPTSSQFKPDTIYSALQSVITQHAPLGCSIVNESILTPHLVRLRRIDLREVVSFVPIPEGADRDRELDRIISTNHSIPFKDLGRLPLWRIVVCVPSKHHSTSDRHGVDISLFIHHALADGGSAVIFHRSLFSALNSSDDEDNVDPIVDVPPLRLLPPLHSLLSMPISWFTLGKVLYHSWFPPSSFSLWTGPVITPTNPLIAETIHFVLPSSAVSSITTLCKENQTSWTALLEAIIAKALFDILPMDGTADQLACCCAFSLRRFIPILDPKDMGVFYASATHHFSRTEMNTSGTIGLWDAARRIKLALDAKIAAGDRDQDTGLLRYASTVRQFVMDQVGKKRRASFEVSNVGVVQFDQTEKGHSVSDWTVQRILFSQSANVVGAPITFSVSSVKGGDMCISASWQVGVVDPALARNLTEKLSALLTSLII